jgi:cysteine-rich repeat protein
MSSGRSNHGAVVRVAAALGALLVGLGATSGVGCGGGGTGTTGTGGAGGTGGTGAGGTTSGPDTGMCGDGHVASTEECDDGNQDNTDDCTNECKVARCGDSFLQPGEECDDGNFDDSDACVTGCVAAACGDGLVQTGVEECDDGNQNDDDACTSQCKPGAGCGNGKVDAGEECDDGNSSNSDDCLDTCVKATCGDGYAHLGAEECDDGNTVNDDNCTNQCKQNTPTSYGCPGVALSVAIGADTTVTGDPSLAGDLYEGSCGGMGGPEIVYEVTPASSGALVATMTGLAGGNPVLYARAAPCQGGIELGCSDGTLEGGSETVVAPVTAGQPVYLFADAFAGTMGKFSLNLHMQSGAPGDTCPGNAVSIAMGSDQTLIGNTAAAGSNYVGKGLCATSTVTKDVVYAVTPTADGTLFAVLDPSYDGQLYARSGSCTTGTQLACSEAGGVGVAESISFPVVAGTKYSVFADGKGGSSGAYAITFHLGP